MSDEKAISIVEPAVTSLAEVETIRAIARYAAQSSFVQSDSKNIQQREADAFFVMMYGFELGIKPAVALRTIYVIKGKPTVSGQAMLSMMLRAGVTVDIYSTETSATVTIKRPDRETTQEASFTKSDAEKAGLIGKDMWKKYLKDMLVWRAVSKAGRMYCPDIIGGLYTAEEIDPDGNYSPDGEPDNPVTVLSGVPSSGWANEDTVRKLYNYICDELKRDDLTTQEFIDAADVENVYDYEAWDRLYETGKAAFNAMLPKLAQPAPAATASDELYAVTVVTAETATKRDGNLIYVLDCVPDGDQELPHSNLENKIRVFAFTRQAFRDAGWPEDTLNAWAEDGANFTRDVGSLLVSVKLDGEHCKLHSVAETYDEFTKRLSF